ncbi:hypothetical protein Y1Q_0002471 [Alligator mississippiensis]|uniref:Uncharacterized protein n=1 Tax=Alligator mississippiensis TaxID=8496 RepID=A0A151NBM8_ALLMI|nr:hypothetical protein Y1Q_0002471 [Alligator mississippiensis]
MGQEEREREYEHACFPLGFACPQKLRLSVLSASMPHPRHLLKNTSGLTAPVQNKAKPSGQEYSQLREALNQLRRA